MGEERTVTQGPCVFFSKVIERGGTLSCKEVVEGHLPH